MLGVDEGGDAPVALGLATTCRASVVLPLDSGPNTSTTRPQGMPCPPKAISSDKLPVGMPLMGVAVLTPKGIMAPSPNSFSIWARVFFNAGLESSIALGASFRAVFGGGLFLPWDRSVPYLKGRVSLLCEHMNSISAPAEYGKMLFFYCFPNPGG